MPKPGNRTRSTVRAAEKEGSVSTMAPLVRRFPRLGSSFQTKVPSGVEAAYQPSRRAPVLLSKEFPDVSVVDAQMDDIMNNGE